MYLFKIAPLFVSQEKLLISQQISSVTRDIAQEPVIQIRLCLLY